MQGNSLKALLGALPGCFAALTVGNALAVDPANYRIGSVLLTPTLETKVGYVDNLFRTDDNKKETGVSIAKPQLQAWMENGLSTYSFKTAAVNYRYFDSSPDNITDNTYNLDLHQVFNARNTADLYVEYWRFHQPRGTDLSQGLAQLIDGPIKLDRTTFGGDYLYGSESSRGRVKLGARTVDHEYKNFPELTLYHDRDRYQYSGTFLWNVAARTDALFEVRHIETDYDRVDPSDAAGSLNSEEFVYLAGVSWEATAKTTGSLRVGATNRDYDSSARESDDVFSWEVDTTYSPKTYSRINLMSRRYFNETNGPGNAVDTEETVLSWDHSWSNRSSTDLGGRFGTQEYTDGNREDDLYGVEATYTYAFRRWLDFGLGYRYEDLDSDLDFYDYSRNEVFVRAELSL